MEERIRPTRSGLFAIELLVAVGVFTFCAAICVGLFVRAELMSRSSADLNRAVNEARNMAECYKAAGGDLKTTAELYGGIAANGVVQAFDADWNRVEGVRVNGLRVALFPKEETPEYVIATVKVEREGEAEPLVQWEVAALREAAA